MLTIRAVMGKQGCCESGNTETQEDFPREVTYHMSPESCIELFQAKAVEGQECFLSEITLSVTVLRRERAQSVGGTEKNLPARHRDEKDQDKANGIGKGHIMQGFPLLLKEFGFILRAIRSHRRILI